MGNQNQLFEIADRQQGFFTAKQAEKCGYTRSNFHLKLASGEWTQEGRGVYRLGRYPITDRPELILWSLWSRNVKDIPQGVWSHETALDIHELSDVMPAKMHMTVPRSFRRRIEVPKLLCLHYAHLQQFEVEDRQGYRVTTPYRTIIDIVEAETVADNFIIQAVNQALKRGLVTTEELQSLQSTHWNIYLKIKRLVHDKF
jgi:predicted transcriptional regulator of viral defense system